MKTNIYESLEKEIMKSNLSEAEKNKHLSKLLKARGQKINILLTGATGSGKSSTIHYSREGQGGDFSLAAESGKCFCF